MSAPSPRTLGCVSIDGYWVQHQCVICMHRVSIAAWKLEGWPERTLADYASKVRCVECQSRHVRLTEVIWCPEMAPRRGQ